jgi:hypothetical protein
LGNGFTLVSTGLEDGWVTTLGLSGSVPSGEVAATFRSGWLRHFKLVLSSAGGAAAAIALMSLLEKQPAEGFKLLGQWGPWPVIALVALILVGGFMSRMNDTVSSTFAAVINSVERQAQASGKTADALTRLADQGGRQAEEVRRLTIFNAQEFPGIYSRFDKQDEVLLKQNDVLQQLHGAVKELVNRGRDDH